MNTQESLLGEAGCPIRVTRFSSLTNPVGVVVDWTWEELAAWFARPCRVDATEKKKLAGYSLATFVGNHRRLDNVELVYAVTLDDDSGMMSVDDVCRVWSDRAGIVHTTYSHTREAPRTRIMLRVSRPMTSNEYRAVHGRVSAMAVERGERLDAAPKDPSRFWFVPAVSPDGLYDVRTLGGEILDVDTVLATIEAEKANEDEWGWLAEMTSGVRPVVDVGVPSAVASPGGVTGVPVARRVARALAWAATCDRSVEGLGDGSGSDNCIRAATGVAVGFDLGEEDALRVLKEAFNPRCIPPWSDAELLHKIRDANRAERIPRGSKLTESAGPETRVGSHANGGTSEGANAVTGPASITLPLVPVALEWIVQVPPVRKWLLTDNRRKRSPAGVLPMGKVAQLVAEGGAGKTMALVQLAVAVATGTAWLGALQSTVVGRVLVILGEEDAEECRRRLYGVCRSLGADAAKVVAGIVFMPLAGQPCSMVELRDRNPVDSPFLIELRAMFGRPESGRWDLIIVDPLSRFAGPDAETDANSGTRFIQALESLCAQTGAVVMVAHHSNKVARADGAKVGTSASRGTSALTDGGRWVATLGVERMSEDVDEAAAGLEVEDGEGRLDEIVTMAFTKSNYAKVARRIMLRRDQSNGGCLLPLDSSDVGMLAEARNAKDPERKKRERNSENEKLREEARVKLRAQTEESKAEGVRKRQLALLSCLRRWPGLSERELALRVSGETGATVGRDTCLGIVASLGECVRTEAGVRNERRHYVVEACVPMSLGGPRVPQSEMFEGLGVERGRDVL